MLPGAMKTNSPSVVQMRCQDVLPAAVGDMVVRAILIAEPHLKAGALVTVDSRRHRIRLLPIRISERRQPCASQADLSGVVSPERRMVGTILRSVRIQTILRVARDSGRSASPSFAEFRGVMYVLNARCPRMA